MEIKLRQGPPAAVAADVVITPAFENEGAAHPLNALTNGWFAEVYESGEFAGKPHDHIVFHRPPNLKAKRLMLVGLGPRDKATTVEFRRAIAAAVRSAKARP